MLFSPNEGRKQKKRASWFFQNSGSAPAEMPQRAGWGKNATAVRRKPMNNEDVCGIPEENREGGGAVPIKQGRSKQGQAELPPENDISDFLICSGSSERRFNRNPVP